MIMNVVLVHNPVGEKFVSRTAMISGEWNDYSGHLVFQLERAKNKQID